MRGRGINSREIGPPLSFAARSAFTPAPFLPRFTKNDHAPVPLFPADSARNAQRGRDRLAPPDAASRHDAAGSRGDLRSSAARLSRAAKNLPHRAGGAGPFGSPRAIDADDAIGRAVARERTLRGLRQGDAAHLRPA